MTREIGVEERFRAVAEQMSCAIGGEAVILHLGTDTYFGLNPVAARVWELLQEPRSVEEISAQVASEFEVSEEQSAADVRRLLGSMLEAQLIAPAP